MNIYANAAKRLNDIITHKRTLTKALNKQSMMNHKDFSIIKALIYGTLRWYDQLDYLAKHLLLKPMTQKNNDIYCLLLIGLHQLMYSNIPNHAVVMETVNGANTLKKTWAKALLNKILRRFIREKDACQKVLNENSAAFYSHPQWLMDSIKTAWPNHWQTILMANNQHPPMTLRINQTKITPLQYRSLLKDNDIKTIDSTKLSETMTLETPISVNDLPGFSEGLCYIQDASGQFIPTLLHLKPGLRVLDACAAPGSKTTHMLETEPNVETLVAIDKEIDRLAKIKDNITRLQLNNLPIHCIKADAIEIKQWWDGHDFDRILIDAPCSSTGVIRRHPDIKLFRRPEDIQQFSNQQYKLLTALWSLLKPSGMLLYTTCSILPQENAIIIEKFINDHSNVVELPIPIQVGRSLTHGHQILPGEANMDGFYYALLQKTK